jgi:hypothetical protein
MDWALTEGVVGGEAQLWMLLMAVEWAARVGFLRAKQ